MSLTSVDLPETPVSVLPSLLVCPECGKECDGPVGLGVHRSTRHGVAGKSHPGRRTPKRKPRLTKMMNTPSVLEKPKPVSPEEIIQTVTMMLWPDGVPPKAMGHVLRWYAQTTEFLELAIP